MLGHNEKRNFIRMNVNSKIEFRREDSSTSYDGKSKDICATGLSFTTPTPVTEGEILDIIIHPGASVTPPLKGKLTVIRVDHDKSANIFAIAGTLEQNE